MQTILTPQELADRLKISPDTLRKMELPRLQIADRLTRYVLEDVLAYLREEGPELTDGDDLGLELMRAIYAGDPAAVEKIARQMRANGQGTEHVIEQHAETVLWENRSPWKLTVRGADE